MERRHDAMLSDANEYQVTKRKHHPSSSGGVSCPAPTSRPSAVGPHPQCSADDAAAKKAPPGRNPRPKPAFAITGSGAAILYIETVSASSGKVFISVVSIVMGICCQV